MQSTVAHSLPHSLSVFLCVLCASVVKKLKGSRVQGYKQGFKGFKGSKVQGFKGSRVQWFKGSRVQGFKGSRVQEFKGSKVQGLWV